MSVLLKKWWWKSSVSILFFYCGFIKAQNFQNLVPNGSFETYTQCPNAGSQIYFSTPWNGPIVNSSDYYNSCSSIMNVPYYCGIGSTYPCFLSAKTGSAYIGIWNYQLNNVREYAQVKLLDTLRNGACYYVEFFATNSQLVKYKTNNIAAAFSTMEYTTSSTPPYLISNIAQHITNYGNPVLKDTVKWEKISGIYGALGNETYILLGNFKDDSNTDTVNIYPVGSNPYSGLSSDSYIFIDAVAVYSFNPTGNLPWSYRDTTINEGASVFIGNTMGGINFHPQWYKEDGSFITTNAGITVSPTLTSNYIVQYTLCGVVRSDTVKVTVNPKNGVGLNELDFFDKNLKVYPIPAFEEITFECKNALNGEHLAIVIQNSLGQVVQENRLIFESKKAIIKTNHLSNGIYFVTIKNQANERVTKKMVVEK